MAGNKKIGVLRFLGTNCDQDVMKWAQYAGYAPEYIWFENQFSINDYDKIIIPGGFSYGDYLRCGALAARSPAMKSVTEFAHKGKPVLGICNGFQILCEAGLLPGALIANESLTFKDQWADLIVQKNKTAVFGEKLDKNQTVRLPIAHGEGRYYDTADGLKRSLDKDLIWLKYKNNPNGALLDIAGLVSEGGNVFALMPHPERALFNWMGSTDGQFFL